MKPTHAKPSLYAVYFLALKEIAKEHGYNLVIHGSLNRDLDLIAIPWVDSPKSELELVTAFSEYVNGRGLNSWEHQLIGRLPGGRNNYVININRGEFDKEDPIDPQYYIDISITPLGK